jgi:hypothetical protein
LVFDSCSNVTRDGRFFPPGPPAEQLMLQAGRERNVSKLIEGRGRLIRDGYYGIFSALIDGS